MAQADFSRIASNIGALNALYSLRKVNSQMGIHQTRLATGKRINSAEEDPAGLSIASKMYARSEGLNVALGNVGDAKNLLAVAESGLSKINDLIITMRSKAQAAASDTLGADERAAIRAQLSNFAAQIDAQVAETKWNGRRLIDGSAGTLTFQTGADNSTEVTTWTANQSFNSTTLSLSTTIAASVTWSATNTVITAAATAAATTLDGSLETFESGAYSVQVLARAASATVGLVNGATSANNSNASLLTATDDGTEANGSGSGNYTLTFTNVDASAGSLDATYVLTDGKGGTWTGAFTNAETTGALTFANSGFVMSSGWALSEFSSGDSINFEYIARGQAKVSLFDSGDMTNALLIDKDGAGSGTAVSQSVYAAMGGAAFNTGRGLTFTLAADATGTANFTWTAESLGIADLSTSTAAASYMEKCDTAMTTVNAALANLGSLMARLSSKEEALTTAHANTEAAYNRIMNADMAWEQVQATKYSILQQTSMAMLSQANTAPQNILSLFR